ncbi:glycosyltransferase [Umezawaea sp. NPDC059074]|uniref:glycosyltransferase n=1 Tax=Umezawaea sp. NPDC059074 TaxID=3346716 RepID=UPI0036B9A870
MSRPLDILIATSPYSGHTAPLVPIARTLVERGHRVRWCAGREFAEQVKSTGATFEPMDLTSDPDGRAIDEMFPERATLKGIAKLSFDIRSVFLDPIPSQLADLRRLTDQQPADAVVHDAAYGGAAALSALGGPVAVSVGTSPMSLPSPYVAPFGLGMQPGSGPASRLRNRALQILLDRVVLRGVHARLHEIQGELGLPPVKRKTMAGISPDLHLQNGLPSLEHPRPDLPSQVHFVGALVDRTTGEAVPPWFTDVLRSDKPVVHVTQGTVADGDLNDLVLPTLRALTDENVLVVAGIGAHEPIPDPPANARVAAFLPHDRLMPTLAVMITNGGFGAIQKALAQGVPLIIAGASEDKPEVAARVARAGVGIDLRTATPKPKAIRAAVRKLLDDPGYRTRARAMAVEYQRYDAGAVAAELIEQVVESKAVAQPS